MTVGITVICIILACISVREHGEAVLDGKWEIVSGEFSFRNWLIESEGGRDDDGIYRYRFIFQTDEGKYQVTYEGIDDLTRGTVGRCVMEHYP